MLPAEDTFPPPPELGTFEQDLWAKLMPRLRHLVHIDRQDIPTASSFVRSAGYYFRLTRKLRELRATHTGEGPLDMEDAIREAARWRQSSREAAAILGLLPPRRSGLALVDGEGEDIELKRIFGLDEA